jgi:hypothetical protein
VFALLLAIACGSSPALAQGEVAAPATVPETNDGTDAQRLEALERELQRQREEYEERLRKLEQQPPEKDPAPPLASSLREDDLEESQLNGLLSAAQEESAIDPDSPAVRIYGFMDVGLQRGWGGLFESGIPETGETTFVLGNVNTYFDAQPTPNWRALTEVRFTLFPQGSSSLRDIAAGDFAPYNATVIDDTATNGGFTEARWNAIVLERAHIDYTPSDLVNLRAGYFLTPYGIWNVDHGSPTRLTLWEPIFMSQEILPKRQLGVELFGRWHFLPWELHYNAYISNGRTPGQVDYSDGKAFGGRIALKRSRPYLLQLGASFYVGGEERVERSLGLREGGELGIERQTVMAAMDYAGAADASLDIGAFRARSEVVVRVRKFEDGKRPAPLGGGFNADQTVTAGYLVLAYRLPFDVEPLLGSEFIREPNLLGEAFMSVGPGVNLYPSPSTVLKLGYSYITALDLGAFDGDLTRARYHFVGGRLALAY